MDLVEFLKEHKVEFKQSGEHKMKRTKERWRWVRKFVGLYKVSTRGRVWSKKGGQWGLKHYLSPNPDKDGYIRVTLFKKGVRSYHMVHKLVLEAFVGPKPDGMEACHFPDRNPANNNLENLRWGSKKDNADDREQHGKTLRGEKANGAKATKLQVIKIRKMFKTGKYPTVRAIANRINLPIGVVRDIIKFATWRHVCS